MLQKTIWSLWFQGWEGAPDLVKACRASWILQNPDWTAHFLSQETLHKYVSASPEFDGMYKKGYPIVVLSDVIRNELLTAYGGIWVDSTAYCLRPLNEWINHALAPSGFFAFNQPGPDRMLSNWFLATAERNNYITRVWLQKTYTYWTNRVERDKYYWHHQLFSDAYQEDATFRKLWDDTPKLSADGPHCFVPSREQLFKPVNGFHRLIVETAQTPMLKLTHKLDHQLGVRGTAYRWLCERVGV